MECWGIDDAVVTDVPKTTGFVAITSGFAHSCALGMDGSIVCWGTDFDGVISMTPTGTGYQQVSAGEGHTCALTTDSEIECWGHDAAGQCSDAP